MTKIICPMSPCYQTDFGVPQASQHHVNHHLATVHNVKVTNKNIDNLRKLQDKAWEAQAKLVEDKRKAHAERNRVEWEAFRRDPSRDLTGSSLSMEHLLAAVAVANADDDAPPDDANLAADTSGAQSQRNGVWFEQGDHRRGYSRSERSTQQPTRPLRSRSEDADARKRVRMAEMLLDFYSREVGDEKKEDDGDEQSAAAPSELVRQDSARVPEAGKQMGCL